MVDDVWEERWSEGRTGFDQYEAHPALTTLLNSDRSKELGIPDRGNALIPGCGRGYDVHLLASRGLDTVGLDIAPTGVEAAKSWIQSQPDTLGKTEVLVADFFKYDPSIKVDVIYDYTFLCALPPDSRSKWARHMTHLSHQSTVLIALMYPLPPTAQPGGPPFALSEAVYKDLLGNEGWEMVWEDEMREPTRKYGAPGGEKLAVWKRKRPI